MTADLDRIRHGLQARLDATAGSTVVDTLVPFGDGHSGFTYLAHVKHDGVYRELVLRLSPPGARIVGPSDVGLQGKIMDEVARWGVPVPAVFDFSSTPVIDDRAFVLMERVYGATWESAGLTDSAIVKHAVRVWTRFQRVPVELTGIALGEGRSPAQEVDRWAALVRRAPSDLQAPLDDVAAELRLCAPDGDRGSLVHGDYHYGNLLFAEGAVKAVFDWEIASIGDPRFDLGDLAVASLRRQYAPEPNPTGSVDVSIAELADLAEVEELSWFVAAACFKYSSILAYNTNLHRQGKRVDPIYDDLNNTTIGLLAQARELLASDVHRVG